MSDLSVNQIFDFLFTGTQAYKQIILMVVGFIISVLGLLLLAHDLYWRMKAQRVKATIIGVQEKKGCYYPVYQYIDSEGKTRTARANGASSLTKRKETGRQCDILIFSSRPKEAQSPRFFLQCLLSIVCLISGFFFFKIAFQYPLTPITSLGGILLLLYIAIKIKPKIRSRAERSTFSSTTARMARQEEKEKEFSPLQSIEEVIIKQNTPEQRAKVYKNARLAAPLCLLMSAGLFFGSYYKGMELFNLSKIGLRAEGHVVSLLYAGDNNERSYYPIVEFIDQKGITQSFKSDFGSNPPFYHVGEKVRVLYHPKNPTNSALIDQGNYWNWLPALLLAAFALMLLLIFFSNLKVLRRGDV